MIVLCSSGRRDRGGPLEARKARTEPSKPFACCASPGPARSEGAAAPCSSFGSRSSPRRRNFAKVHHLTRMQLIRTLAAWRPEVSTATDPVTAYRVSMKSLARRYVELTDEIADLDELITPIVEALAPPTPRTRRNRHRSRRTAPRGGR